LSAKSSDAAALDSLAVPAPASERPKAPAASSPRSIVTIVLSYRLSMTA
jgi:hypothetical protein